MVDFCTLVREMYKDEEAAVAGYQELLDALAEYKKTFSKEELEVKEWMFNNIEGRFKSIQMDEALHRDIVLGPIQTICNESWLKRK